MGCQLSANRQALHQDDQVTIVYPPSPTGSTQLESGNDTLPSASLQSEYLLTSHSGKQTNHGQYQVNRIDMLPDEVLLDIFDFLVIVNPSFSSRKEEIEAWQTLVHVCRRWRILVFGSPRRLHLRLLCTHEASALLKEKLDVWPAFPIIVQGVMNASGRAGDNIIAALGQSNRVCQVNVKLGQQFEQVMKTMEVSFPELTVLRFDKYSFESRPSLIPDSFLGGSAPSLRVFDITGLAFPGLPKLLSSATHLTSLTYSNRYDIPCSGYISTEVIVTLISVLSNLRMLSLTIRSPRSRPYSERSSPPPPKRSILPALASLNFAGVLEYLEELVSRVDTPQLDKMDIEFFYQNYFDCPRLAQFINRAPKLGVPDKADVQLCHDFAEVKLRFRTSDNDPKYLRIHVPCGGHDSRQFSFIQQVFSSSLYPVFTVEDLYINYPYSRFNMIWTIENTVLVQLLLAFTAVMNLYLAKKFAPAIAADLRELVEGRIAEALQPEPLPNLQNIFVEALKPSGPFWEDITPFVTARQLSGQPVTISDWPKR